MTSAFDTLVGQLKRLPGLGFRSAERIATHLLVERRERLAELAEALSAAGDSVGRCTCCGNLAEDDLCRVCSDTTRDRGLVCVVEHVPDLMAIERSLAWKGLYHVLHGKLSPIHGVGPEALNLESLARRIESGGIEEFVFALSNDIEGQATCHYIQEELIGRRPIRATRIGFGLPSGAGVTHADAVTLKSALDGRRQYE